MPASVEFIDTDKGMDDIIAEIEKEGGYVDIGVQSDESEGLLVIAGANEFGTETIPARPFIRGTIDSNEELFMRHADTLADDILDGNMTKHAALVEMGQLIEGETKKYMINLRTPPNAPYTIKQKGSDNPLIDTGLLVGSIRYAVSKGEA